MELLAALENILSLGKSTSDKQKVINVAEVWHIWDHLVSRYDVIEREDILANFAHDTDLKVVLTYSGEILRKNTKILEQLMVEYGVPLPMKPPVGANTTINVEVVTDRYIFRSIHTGIQAIIPSHSIAFSQSTSPKMREIFKGFIIDEMNLFDKIVEFGKIKGWLVVPPAYRA